MTRVSVVPLTSDRHADWVKVYNEGRLNLSGFVPLHEQELRVMMRNHVCDQETMYFGLEGRRPTAVARYLEDADSGMSFITDLISLPGMTSGVEALVEFFMLRARENRSTVLTSWTFLAQVSVPDILSKFTFDTRRVQHEMTIDLSPTQKRESLRNTQVRRWDDKNSSLRIPTLKSAHGIRPLNLFEIRDQSSDDWQPRFLGFGDEGNAPLVVAFRSKPNRKKGRIVLLLAAANVLKQNDLFSELTNDLVVCLYQDGVRQVKLEMDAEISLKQVLLDSGFKVSRTLFEMCLEILQD